MTLKPDILTGLAGSALSAKRKQEKEKGEAEVKASIRQIEAFAAGSTSYGSLFSGASSGGLSANQEHGILSSVGVITMNSATKPPLMEEKKPRKKSSTYTRKPEKKSQGRYRK